MLTVDELRNVSGVKWSLYPDCIGAFVAEMDFGTAPEIQHVLRKIVDDGIFGYTHPKHIERMALAYQEWSSREYGWDIPVEWIRSVGDVIAGFEATVSKFTREGARILVPTPAYMPFLTLPEVFGRELVEIPMHFAQDRWQFDYHAIEAAYANDSEGALFVLCNPCNPLGRVYESDELAQLTPIIDRYNGRVFSDEIHAPLVYPGRMHVPYASTSELAASHTLTAASASKAWNLAGLKSAQFILSNETDATHWTKAGKFVEHGASTPGVIANGEAYASGKAWLDEVITYLDGNRRFLGELLTELLPDAEYTMPEATYLAWIDLGAYELPANLDRFFRNNAGVAIVDGASCGKVGNQAIRFNFAMARDLVEQSVQQMAAAIQNSRTA